MKELLLERFSFLEKAGTDHTGHVYRPRRQNGILTDYPVFPGAEFLLTEYQGSHITVPQMPPGKLLLIHCCLEGRLEWTCSTKECVCLNPGDIALHMLDCCSLSEISLPMGFYRGITVLLDTETFSAHLPDALGEAGFSTEKLTAGLDAHKPVILLPVSETGHALFSMPDRTSKLCCEPYLQIKLQELLLLFCFQDLCVLPARPSCQASVERTVRAVREKLVADLKSRPTIAELSKEFLINSSALKDGFKAVYGQPIAQYMKACRIHRAASLLASTDLSVKEIALAVGYESQSKFSAAFKEIMKVSPAKYRARVLMRDAKKPAETAIDL